MNIADTIANARQRGAHRPFKDAKMTRAQTKRIDPSTLVVCNDPIPGHRASCGNKYEAVLKSLKYGQCVKCAPSAVGGVAGALRKMIELGKVTGVVRTMKDYEDNFNKIWLMEAPKAKLAAVRG